MSNLILQMKMREQFALYCKVKNQPKVEETYILPVHRTENFKVFHSKQTYFFFLQFKENMYPYQTSKTTKQINKKTKYLSAGSVQSGEDEDWGDHIALYSCMKKGCGKVRLAPSA